MRNASERKPVSDTESELNTVACVRVHSNMIIEYGEPMLKCKHRIRNDKEDDTKMISLFLSKFLKIWQNYCNSAEFAYLNFCQITVIYHIFSQFE